jgi:hypothetical protein
VNFDIKWKVRQATKGDTFGTYACGGDRVVILDGTAEKKLALQPKGGIAPPKKGGFAPSKGGSAPSAADAGKQIAVRLRKRRWDASDLWRDLGQSCRL